MNGVTPTVFVSRSISNIDGTPSDTRIGFGDLMASGALALITIGSGRLADCLEWVSNRATKDVVGDIGVVSFLTTELAAVVNIGFVDVRPSRYRFAADSPGSLRGREVIEPPVT